MCIPNIHENIYYRYTSKNPEKMLSFSSKIEDFFSKMGIFLLKFAEKGQNFLHTFQNCRYSFHQ